MTPVNAGENLLLFHCSYKVLLQKTNTTDEVIITQLYYTAYDASHDLSVVFMLVL